MNASRRILLTAALAVPFAALAHHGWSEYDQQNVLKLTGTIEEAGYEHPHGHIKLKTPGKTWIAVLAPPSHVTGPPTPGTGHNGDFRRKGILVKRLLWAGVAVVGQ